EARAADERRRRSVVDAALTGEAEAKAGFADSSRRIATEFDRGRESARNEANRAKNESVATFQAAQNRAAKDHAGGMKPIDDLAQIADANRRRLATIAADYAKFRLDPNAPTPALETYSTFADPLAELFTRLTRMDTPLKLLEGLIIPKTMKGGREVWIFILVILLIASLAVMAGGGVAGLGGGVAAGAALAVLLRMSLAKLCKNQLEHYYVP